MLIDGEHTVGIAVESCSQIGTDLAHLLLHVNHVLWLDGTGGMMGETDLPFKVEANPVTRGWRHSPRIRPTCPTLLHSRYRVLRPPLFPIHRPHRYTGSPL